MKNRLVRLLQSRLATLGHDPGSVDGLLGPATLAAVTVAFPDLPPDWPARRRAIAALQSIARAEGFDAGPIDGLFGPQTAQAVAALETGTPPDWRDMAPVRVNPNGWPAESGVTAFYGPQGRPGGFTPPLVRVPSPWQFRIAWDLNRTRDFLWAHERTAPSVARILHRIHLHYGTEQLRTLRLDIFSGDYSPRLMRGSRTRWSMHSWGIAYDFDDSHNRLTWGADRAHLARPEYRPFWEIWEAEGWTSLGRSRNFDWMHVQAARLD